MIKELNYELTKKDILKFLYFHQFKNKFTFILCVVIIFILMTSNLIIHANNLPLIVGITLILLFILVPVIGASKYKKITYKIKIDNENSILIGDSDYGHSELNWSQMYKIYKSKYLLLIYMTKMQAIIIPKRIFESEQEMNETWELIQECYNKNRDIKS